MNKLLLNLCLLLLATIASAQELLKIQDRSISLNDFEDRYQLNLKEEGLNTTMNTFLDLELLYQDALNKKFDTLRAFNILYGTKKNNLTKNYLSEKQVIQDFLKEQYRRSITDLNVEFVVVNQQELAEQMHRQVSIGVKSIADLLNENKNISGSTNYYIRGMDENHLLEDLFFTTKIGETTKLLPTPNGFVFGRVLQTMPYNGNNKYSAIVIEEEKTTNAQEKINQAYSKLAQGSNFFETLNEYTTNKEKKLTSGILDIRGRNIPAELESAIKSIKNVNDYTTPKKINNNWYIIKWVLHENCEIDNKNCYDEFNEKYFKSDRYKVLEQILYNHYSKEIIQPKINQKIVNNFVDKHKKYPILDSVVAKKVANILTLNNNKITTKNLALFVNSVKEKIQDKSQLKNWINQWLEAEQITKTNREYWDHLEDYDADFKLLNEKLKREIHFQYYNSIYLDSIIKTNEKEKKEYYLKNINKYQSTINRIIANLYQTTSQAKQKNIVDLINNKTEKDSIIRTLNPSNKEGTFVFSGKFLVTDKRLPNDFKPNNKTIYSYQKNNQFFVLHVLNPTVPNQLEYDEVVTKVADDYKQYWWDMNLNQLKQTIQYSINPTALEQLKQKYD